MLTAMGWLRASLKHKKISGIEISQRNVYTALSVPLPPKTGRAKRNEVMKFASIAETQPVLFKQTA